MAAAAAPSPAVVGRRILGEVEETSLEDVLQRIRAEAAARAQHRLPAATVAAATAATAATQHGGPLGHSLTNTAGAAAAPTAPPRLPSFPVPALQDLVARHFRATRAPELVVGGGRPLALVYLLVAALIAAPCRQAVVVVDVEARFDARQLLGCRPTTTATTTAASEEDDDDLACSPVDEDDLQHVHVFRVDPRWRAPLAELVAAAEQRVLYGAQRRRDRPWWGTLVVGGGAGGGSSSAGSAGGAGAGAALVTGYYGWLRVDALQKDEYQAQQERRQRLLALFDDGGVHSDGDGTGQDADGIGEEDASGVAASEPITWVASSPWGSFTFRLPRPAS